MKEQAQVKKNRSAEEWVEVARQFGEHCVDIQHDSKLTVEQKLEKQKTLSEKISKDIETDSNLKANEKKQMVDSLNNYMHEWKLLNDAEHHDKSCCGCSSKKK